jgi:hypothetical protein
MAAPGLAGLVKAVDDALAGEAWTQQGAQPIPQDEACRPSRPPMPQIAE